MARNRSKKNKNKAEASPSASTAERAEPAVASPPEQAPAQQAAPGQPQWPLLYRNPRPLHLRDHADLAIKVPVSFGFAAKATVVPVVLGEFLACTRDYPVVFSADTPPTPIAFLGLRREENLFVNGQGRWDPTAYIPAYVRRYPFLLLEVGEPKRRILFVDEGSPLIVHGEGTPLVEDGKPSQAATTALRFCEAFLADQEKTLEFTNAITELGLLESRNVTLTLGTGEKMALRDMRIISPQKLDELPDQVLLEWRRRKWLFPALCHVQSLINWQRIASRIRKPRS